MTAEYQLAHDLTSARGDHLAQIKRLEREVAEIKWVHKMSCPSKEKSDA